MSQKPIYGFDFGTSNSAISIIQDGKAKSLDINQYGQDKTIMPTLLYFNEKETFFGSEAESKHREVNDPKARYIRAIKSAASIAYQDGTNIHGEYRTFVDLISTFISHVKEKSDSIVGEDVKDIVIGRPVKFSDNKEDDQLAQTRVYEAAEKAGFENIHFTYEPIGATFNATESLNSGDNILTFDFGGGTLDFHLLKYNGSEIQTINTHGIPIGGTDITKYILAHKVLSHFGQGVEYTDKWRDWRSGTKSVPNSLPSSFLDFDTQRDSKYYQRLYDSIKEVQWEAKEGPLPQLEALKTCLEERYFFDIFDEAEAAKIALSSNDLTKIRFKKKNVDISESISRADFDDMLSYRVEKKITKGLEQLFEDSEVQAEDINVILRIGGSSEIPFFSNQLSQLFPASKIIRSDIFGGVSKGLARIGHDNISQYLI
jgi:hypothetical chaperone protein